MFDESKNRKHCLENLHTHTGKSNMCPLSSPPLSCSLKDTLVSYMERKDLDVPHDVDELFPGEITLAQYIEAWKFTVAFKQERSQR